MLLINNKLNVKQYGFSLLELMFVLLIIGIISMFAYPSYVESQVRSRITEGTLLTLEAHLVMGVADLNSVAGLNAMMANWNARLNGNGASSKYVRSLLFDENDNLVMTLNENNVGSFDNNSNTIIYTPYLLSGGAYLPVRQAIIAGNVTGFVRWACISTTGDYSQISQGLPEPELFGTVPSNLVPTSCR
ncbi:pilin [Eionea flava]